MWQVNREERDRNFHLSEWRQRWRKLQQLWCCLKLACDGEGEKLFVNLDCFCHWSILACHGCCRKSFVSHTQGAHTGIITYWVVIPLLVSEITSGHHQTGERMPEWQIITELQDRILHEQTIDWEIGNKGSNNRGKSRADDENCYN